MKKIILITITIIALFQLAGAQPDSSHAFKMLRSNLISGLIPDIDDAYGVAFRDFNQDGYPDIYLVCFRNLNRLLINNGGIIPFIDRTVYSGVAGYLMSHGETNLEVAANAADYDNDGKADIFLAGWGKTSKLFRNLERVVFEDVTANMEIQGIIDANQGLWLDADNDGYLDLYITDEHYSNRLLINKRNGFFKETIWTESFLDTAKSQGSCAGDFDLDGDIDIYVANWAAEDYFLINNGEALFDLVKLDLPTLKQKYVSNSAARADIDNDGDLDLLVATKNGYVFFYKNESAGGQLKFKEITDHPFYEIGKNIYGFLLQDFNQDGWVDCFIAIQGSNRLYLNDGGGGFEKNYDTDGRDARSTGSAAADFDQDGDLDIFVSNRDALSEVYLNPTNKQNFIKLRLTGVRSNRDALGSKVYFYAGEDTNRILIGYREVGANCGYLSSVDPVVHFGAGNHKSIDVEIIFPSGKEVKESNLTPGNIYEISEYGILTSELYFALNTLRFQASRPVFWGNLVLIMLLLILAYGYIQYGGKRYQWSAGGVTTQLSIWFVVALGIIILFRKSDMHFILLALNGVTIFGVIIAVGYSEHWRNLQKRRTRFRAILQSLSGQMINIHNNEELYQSLLKTISKHEEIKRANLLLIQSNKIIVNQISAAPQNQSLKNYQLSKSQTYKIFQKKIINRNSTHEFNNLFEALSVNILLPIKRDKTIFGLICVDMDNSASHLNQEDLQLILTIANQTAIAIENNNYIEESAKLIKKLTAAQIREKYLKRLEQTNKELDQKNLELTRLFKELQQKEAQLIHSEKMASLGQLVAGISHELNNPISFIYANTQALKEYIENLESLWADLNFDKKNKTHADFENIINELKSIITDNIDGSRSVKELVLNLKNFSRLDQAEWKEAHLAAGVESSLKILKPQLSDQIEVITQFDADPLIFCNPGQLNQVFINLISNAIQALKGSSKIFIKTMISDNNLIIKVQDTGTGISKKVISKIFDPFFTTKDVNKGTGLGLTISYSIIQKHGGRLTVESEQGKGSVFTIHLPLKTNQKYLSRCIGE